MSPINTQKGSSGDGLTFAQKQQLAKQRSYEKRAKTAKIGLSEIAIFTQQLASMVEAGLALANALEAMEDQIENPVFRVIIHKVRKDINAGSSFSDAVKKFPNAFPPLFFYMVEAGEASGGLSTLLKKVADYLEASVRLVKKVKGALIYPVAVIGVSILIVIFLMVKIVPQFIEMFDSFGAELPVPTQILIGVSEFVKSNILFMAIAALATYFGLGYYFKTPKGRVVKDQIKDKLPIVGVLTKKVSLSRFMHTYAILARSGVPILRALEICAGVSQNTFIEASCKRIIDHVAQGGQMSEVLSADPYIPSLVMHMAKAGERIGNIDGMLDKVADFYDNDVDTITGAMTSLIQPFVIVFLGVVVGGIVLALFLPILNLSQAAGG